MIIFQLVIYQRSLVLKMLICLIFITVSISACSTPVTPTTRSIAQPETKIAPSPAPNEVKQELSFFPGAGGLDCPIGNVLLNPQTIYPTTSAFHPSLMVASADSLVICLFDFPIGENFIIELLELNGELLVSGTFNIRVEEVDGEPRFQAYWLDSPIGVDLVGDGYPSDEYPDRDGYPNVVVIDIAWSRSLPNRGLIRVNAEDFQIENEFQNPFGEFSPWLSVLPPNPPNPWAPFVERGCLFYSTGEKVEFIGGGFSPDSQVAVGVYHDLIPFRSMGKLTAKLSASGVLTTDPNGYLTGTVQIEPTDPVGIYFVIAVLNPEGRNAGLDHIGPITCYQVR